MDYDVIVIGSGQAGVPLAVRLAGAGRRVLLAERSALGGTCVNRGCTPTKTMIASARAAHVARNAGRLGVRTGEVTVDLAAVVDRKDAIVERWRAGVQKRLDGAGERLTVAHGHARFTGPRTIEVGGATHRADLVVVNTGVRPAVPTVPGIDDVPWLDNTRLMQLRTVPTHLLVIGGGYIGCEFAQAFRRFGAAVTVFDTNERLLHVEDPDVGAEIEKVFRNEGIALEFGAHVTQVARRGDGVSLTLRDGRTIAGSHLLVAAGRTPNTQDLGCEAGGIALDARGYVPVDDHYRTSADGVHAVGDVTPGPQFTHAAWDDHRILFDLLTGRGRRTRAQRLVPGTAFTDPQVARVGLTETEARARGLRYEVATMPFGDVARAIEVDETAGVLKVLLDPDTERLLGAAIVGTEAGELIHTFIALMEAGVSPRALVDAEAVHPAFAEGLQSVLMRLPRFALA